MLPLSPNTSKSVDVLFVEGTRNEARSLLIEKCGNNLPNCKDSDEYDLEDLRIQVLKLSRGNLEELRTIIGTANTDWREVVGSPGSVRRYKRKLLGSALEVNAKSNAIWNLHLLNTFVAAAAFFLALVLTALRVSELILVLGLVLVALLQVLALHLIHSRGGLSRDPHLGLFLYVLTYVAFPTVGGYLLARAALAFL